MKHYTFFLMPEKAVARRVEILRSRLINTTLVDGLPAHLSFKRRFFLKKGFREDYLKKVLRSFRSTILTGSVRRVRRLGEAMTILIQSNMIVKAHRQLLTLLSESTVTLIPKHEGNNFLPHITIVRDRERTLKVKLADIAFRRVTFDTLCLYEIDPKTRKWARKIVCKKLGKP